MNEFKLSKKKIHNDSRSTIEEVHDSKMKEILDNMSNLESKKKKLKKLEQYYNVLCNNISSKPEQLKVHDNINQLKNEISDIESNYDAMDYVCKAWEFIENIEDLDKLNEMNNNDNNDNNNELEQNNDNEKQTGILKYVNQTGQSKKGQIYNEYIDKCFKNVVINKNSSYTCKNCDSNNFTYESGQKICSECGCCENYIDTTINSINYNDIITMDQNVQTFSYQRKNHFKEWLNQLQAKEVTNIPDTVINLLLIEINY